MNAHILDDFVVQRLIPDLQADGYSVFKNPDKRLLPLFFDKYSPDLIALRDDKNLVIELTNSADHEKRSIETISKLLDGHSDWELRVIMLPVSEKIDSLRMQSQHTIEQFMLQCQQLANQGQYPAAFLLLWATLEAFGRNLLQQELAKPQTPGRVIEQLAHEGWVTPDEAHILRSLSLIRNRLIHGELDVTVGKSHTHDMLAIINNMMSAANLQ